MAEKKARADGKVQVVMLLEAEVRDRLDALRIITRMSRARVAEEALVRGGIRALELGHVRDLARVLALAERAGMKQETYVRAYARAYATATFGPGLDALERNDDEVTGRNAPPPPAPGIPRIAFSETQKR